MVNLNNNWFYGFCQYKNSDADFPDEENKK